jgi:hypothetical protein
MKPKLEIIRFRDITLISKYITYLIEVNHPLYCNSNAAALFTILVISIIPKKLI